MNTVAAAPRTLHLTSSDMKKLRLLLAGVHGVRRSSSLRTLEEDLVDYVRFHLATVGCRLCQANLKDLRRRQAESDETVVVRRKRYFDSSAGYLHRRDSR